MPTVNEKVLSKIRAAMLGSMPIIYIKTDSDNLIRELLTDTDNPPVVLRYMDTSGTGSDYEMRTSRPVYEVAKERMVRLCDCANLTTQGLPYSNSGMTTVGTEETISELNDQPHVWVFKMHCSSNEEIDIIDDSHKKDNEGIFQKLEKYVAAHENPLHPDYTLLNDSVVILYSHDVILPQSLKPYTEVISVPFPDTDEIKPALKAEIDSTNDTYLSEVCSALHGFTKDELEVVIRRISAMASFDEKDNLKVKKIIRDYKNQRLEGSLLELCSTENAIGGMSKYKGWLNEKKDQITNHFKYKHDVGINPPKGVLLCGIPGCGKSEAARFTASTLDLPLLKMDMGSLMNSKLGASEQRMREALKMAEAISPCVLWIDELEKGFSGAGDNNSSSTFKRMFGYMLGWMQDNKEPVFIFATANDIGSLPKEFFRSGRFSALFATYLPTADECVDIFFASMDRAVRTFSRENDEPRKEWDKLVQEKTPEDQILDVIRPMLFNEYDEKHKSRNRDKIKELINRNLVNNDRPQIIIGSDIQEMVNVALGKLGGRGIGQIPWEDWIKTLEEAIKKVSKYGDGEENIDSIAIGYCRMLRKGLNATSDKVLFNSSDYSASEYLRLRRQLGYETDQEERNNLANSMKDIEILQMSDEIDDLCAYDKAVYKYLGARINEIAPSVETHELDKMIKR